MAVSEEAMDEPYGVCAVRHKQTDPIMTAAKNGLTAAFNNECFTTKMLPRIRSCNRGIISTVWG